MSFAFNNTVGLDDRIARVVIILMALGAVFVFSAGTSLDQEFHLEHFYAYASVRQLLFFPMACLIMYLVSCMDHRRLSLSHGVFRSITPYLLGVSIVLLIAVLIPGLGVERHAARRWFRFTVGAAQVSFQPSELAKWALVFFIAAVCAKNRFRLDSFRRQFLPICAVIALVVGLIVVEDLGTAAFLSLLSFLMLCVGGARGWHLLSPMPLAAAGFYVMVMKDTYRQQRLAAFLNPEKWADSVAYQANQSLIALGSGGLWGKGLGNGISKYGHLPEDTTDFVFAIIGEELGLIGTLSVILLFLCFIWLGLLVILRCENGFSRLLATGIVLTLGLQAALNIGVVTVVLPTKGIPLPFLSGGGTSLLLSAAAAGVLLNIAKSVQQQSPKHP